MTASRLSYAIWDTMPDAELFAAAARGDLATPQGVEKAARRMLDHPRAATGARRIRRPVAALRPDSHRQQRPPRSIPQFTRETAVAMTEEARMFVGDLVWNDRNFMDLFTANYGFVNADLAPIYKVPRARQGVRPRRLPGRIRSAPACSARPCSWRSRRSPRTRLPRRAGLFVREQFLCQHVPDPPAGVNTNLPPVTEAKPQTNRDRMSEHATNPSCATCHKLIDPIGFGLEKFDAVGARRDKFTLQFFVGRAAKAEAGAFHRRRWISISTPRVLSPASPIRSSLRRRELGAVLAKSAQCQECIVKQYFRYIAGPPGDARRPSGDPQLLDDFQKSQFHFKELIVSLMRSREFPNSERDCPCRR